MNSYMMTKEEQIDIVNKRLSKLEEQVVLINSYMNSISEGMEDPDQPLERYPLRLQEIQLQIQALTQHREML